MRGDKSCRTKFHTEKIIEDPGKSTDSFNALPKLLLLLLATGFSFQHPTYAMFGRISRSGQTECELSVSLIIVQW